MRTIKFRGKCTDDGMWRHGDLLHADNLIWINDNGLHCTVDEKTVGQFTGLHDKNGEEIYEGDIIYSEFPDGSKTNGLIEWDEEYSCFGLMDEYNYRSKLKGYEFPKFDNAIFYNFRKHSKKFEVIGNIYDNPELLSRSEQA